MDHNAGRSGSVTAPLPPIKFAALADALLGRIDQLLPKWLPGGVVKNGEYFVSSVFRHEKTPSLSVRMSGASAGCWRDHGGDEKGGDLIGLYAAIHGLAMGNAAVAVAREEGLEDVAGVTHASGDVAPRPVRVVPAAAPVAARPRSDEGWRTVTPVPAFAPAPTFWHQFRNSDVHKDPIDHLAVYTIDGALMGHVVRFLTSEGKKETLPYTWCISAKDGGCKWHWKTWDEPRPLYFPAGKSPMNAVDFDGQLPTVVVVEGEKKASILQALLGVFMPGVYVVVSWAGGCKAWAKSDWSLLNGCTVLLWPDCDGHREPLTKKERESCLDDAARDVAQTLKPVLPADKQPGMRAMLGIGAMLRDAHACTVAMLQIPAPLEVTDGWDCADAINTDKWDGERVLAFFGRAQPFPAGAGDDAAKARSDQPVAPFGGGQGGDLGAPPANAAGPGGGDDAFRDHLMFMVDSLKLKGVHEINVNRKLVIAALRKAPALRDCLGFNELTGVPSTRVPLPWRTMTGALEDMDDLALGDWVCTEYSLKGASRAALSEAIDTVADSRRFHPVRDWLNGLQHDGKPRLEKWLIYVLGLELDDTKAKQRKLKRYLELVGKYMLLGLVARVMKPGCKFDYSPVLEGPGGIGKSTFIKVLVGEDFFSDTHFDIGQGKDGMEQFCGVWAYELSELTALRRADSEQVKQFFSSQKDRFRGAYGRYVQDHPRQLVIFCSTNKKQYLYDTTGNRRFWPFWIKKAINLPWLRKWREMLFAEAMALYQAGAQIYPSLEEEELYFVPEQEKRLVETSVQSRLYELLTRQGAGAKEGSATLELNQLTEFVTLDKLVIALGTDPGKASTLLEGQIRGWLEAQGWEYGRESTGARRRGFSRPAVWPPVITDEADADASTPGNAAGATEGNDDDPF